MSGTLCLSRLRFPPRGLRLVCWWQHKLIKQGRDILDLFGKNMCDVVGSLHAACHSQHAARDNRAAKRLIDVTPDDNVHHACFIFQREKDDAFGCAGPLTQDDKARNRHPCIDRRQIQLIRAQARRWSRPALRRWKRPFRRCCRYNLHGNKNRTNGCKCKL